MHAPRRIVLALTLAALAAAPWGGVARATAPVQETTGEILLPLRFAADVTYASWPGGQRNVYNVTQNNGTVGYTFEVAPAAAGGTYVLDVTGGSTGQEDLDIAFYASIDPVAATGQHQTRGTDAERGDIPSGTRWAIVTMYDGAAAEFRFRAFPGTQPARDSLAAPLPVKPGIYPTFGLGPSAIAGVCAAARTS